MQVEVNHQEVSLGPERICPSEAFIQPLLKHPHLSIRNSMQYIPEKHVLDGELVTERPMYPVGFQVHYFLTAVVGEKDSA